MLTLALAFVLLLLPAATSAQETWSSGLTLSQRGEFTHAGLAYRSSSSLVARWTPPNPFVRRYLLLLTEARGTRVVELPMDAREATLTDLKAGTEYSARLRACTNETCSGFLEAEESPQASTAEEYWRITGTGRSFASADRVVEDGNVGSHAFKYGPWAGPLDGRLQLYYAPMQREEKGVKLAEQTSAATGSVEDALRFRGLSGFGLLRTCQPPAPGQPSTPEPGCTTSRSLVTTLALFQAVPVASRGLVRLYFEAQGYDGRTRILHLDSQDGFAGRDFHRGPETRCNTMADYSPGGGCEPSLDIGVGVDGERGFPGIESARQFKVAYPTRESWAWDEAPGTMMWFTTEWQNRRCSDFGFNAAFAVWDGTRWVVQDAGDGCPKLLKGVQAPAPVHLGGRRYKLYFNRHRSPGGPGNPQAAIKPMQMIYADGERTGETSRVDFEDWEPVEAAREIHYVWPDGGTLTEDEESRLDDYVVLAPTSDPLRLVMYSNMSSTGAGALPFIGSAVLINP